MYMRRTKGAKRDPIKQWRLPDRVFFACGACHVLASAFLRTYPESGFTPIWIRPVEDHTGHHIVAVRDNLAFDYHGYSDWPRLLAHMKRRAHQWSPGWDATLVPLPEDVLGSESKSRMYDGLWLKEPSQFLFDAMPRAQAYVQRFPAPPQRRSARSSNQALGWPPHNPLTSP
jgi:hypothetical protein